MTTETPPLEEILLNLSDELLTTDVVVKPAHRAARLLIPLMERYEADPITSVREALADMFHAADALGLDWKEVADTAFNHYVAEVEAHGVAPCLVPPKPAPEPVKRMYTVIVTRDVTESVALQVEAYNGDEAEELAIEQVQELDVVWAVDGDNINDSPYVTDVSLSDSEADAE